MDDAFRTAVAVGLAVASVNAFFVWHDHRSRWRAIRRFVGWLVAFLVAGLIAPGIAAWILTHVV